MKPLNCKLSMGSDNLKFHKIISILQNNNNYWFMVDMAPLSYGCTWKVARNLRNWSLTCPSPYTTPYTSLRLNNLLCTSIILKWKGTPLLRVRFFGKTWIRILETRNGFSLFFLAKSKNELWIQDIHTRQGYFRSNLNWDFSKDSQKVYLASSFPVILLFKQIAQNSELKKEFHQKETKQLPCPLNFATSITVVVLYYSQDVPWRYKANSPPCFQISCAVNIMYVGYSILIEKNPF